MYQEFSSVETRFDNMPVRSAARPFHVMGRNTNDLATLYS